jgi:hypothetical protein
VLAVESTPAGRAEEVRVALRTPSEPATRVTSPVTELRRSSLASRRQELAALLRQHEAEAFCFSCLAARLEMSPTRVRDAAQLLIVTPHWRVHRGTCRRCGREDEVIRFVPPTASTAGNRHVTNLLASVASSRSRWERLGTR